MTDLLSCSSPQPQDIHLPFSSHILTNAAQRDVTYSCGSCGYELNLNSCNRNTTVIGSKYGKTMRRGVLSFLCIDESRFTQIRTHMFEESVVKSPYHQKGMLAFVTNIIRN
ncbi:hypothetical protein KY285_026827 [Solanum tuberosum]|nr:hypothetical protein KY285_026827 [Solanum tuberosum]